MAKEDRRPVERNLLGSQSMPDQPVRTSPDGRVLIAKGLSEAAWTRLLAGHADDFVLSGAVSMKSWW